MVKDIDVKLSQERTILSNERTMLSHMRTAFALIILTKDIMIKININFLIFPLF